MPDIIRQAIATEGFYWLALTIFMAGLIRGFTGFGSALIFVPVAGAFLPPAVVVGLVTVMGVASSVALIPGAWRIADKREISILVIAVAISAPLGIVLMGQMDSETVRWIVSLVAGGTLIALIAGWQYHGRLGWSGLGAVGGAAGVVGGVTGMAGPVVILFYLASARSVTVVRANIILFLAATDVIIVSNLYWQGLVSGAIVVLGLLLAVPYIVTTLIGQAAFRPEYVRLYRWASYSMIVLAVGAGLPVWD